MNTRRIFTAILFLVIAALAARTQTSAFNFQGRLNDGSTPANGRYDLQFKLFDAITGGDQIGATLDKANTMLVNGVFSTALDFGSSAFASGNRFIEIAVRPAGSPNAHIILGGRQQILSVPFAVRSVSSANADLATLAQNATFAAQAGNADHATDAVTATTAATAQNSLSLGGQPASSYARLNFANQGDISAANMSTTGYMSVGGNAIQTATSFGVPKAMVFVEYNTLGSRISRCFNGVTGQASGTCGFTLTSVGTGIFFINLGFAIQNRFALVTVYNDTSPLENYGANFRFTGSDLEVLTFVTDDSNDTAPVSFMAIVY